jgi:hypothetical protein
MDLSPDVKQILLFDTKAKPHAKKTTRTIVTEKPKVDRVITKTETWTRVCQTQSLELDDDDVEPSHYSLYLSGEETCIPLVEGQIRRKLSSYKSQDLDKGVFSQSEFATFQDVVDLFRRSVGACYYCHQSVLILYQHVRDPRQWTLERLDNSQGHNRDNVELACLSCNLRRRCMASERYVKTKAMTTIVKMGS